MPSVTPKIMVELVHDILKADIAGRLNRGEPVEETDIEAAVCRAVNLAHAGTMALIRHSNLEGVGAGDDNISGMLVACLEQSYGAGMGKDGSLECCDHTRTFREGLKVYTEKRDAQGEG